MLLNSLLHSPNIILEGHLFAWINNSLISLYHHILMQDSHQVSMAMKMATVDKAEDLLEKLRIASWDAAVQGMI